MDLDNFRPEGLMTLAQWARKARKMLEENEAEQEDN